MRLLLLFLISACASAPLLPGPNRYEARDYLKTAYETLVKADPDTEGHRIRAELETQAALQALGDEQRLAREVPFQGPPTLAVALELLRAGEAGVTTNVPVRVHTQRAMAELQAALGR